MTPAITQERIAELDLCDLDELVEHALSARMGHMAAASKAVEKFPALLAALREAETQRDAAIARAEKAEREVAELREALKPFAEASRDCQSVGADAAAAWEAPEAMQVSLGDFRRAAKAVAPNGEGRDAG